MKLFLRSASFSTEINNCNIKRSGVWYYMEGGFIPRPYYREGFSDQLFCSTPSWFPCKMSAILSARADGYEVVDKTG